MCNCVSLKWTPRRRRWAAVEVVSLTDLKPGFRANVLLALALAIAPATVEVIMDRSGCSRDTIHDALRWLSKPEQGLAYCVPGGRWPTWSLTPAGIKLLRDMLEALQGGDSGVMVMPLPAASDLSAPESPANLMPLPAASNTHKDEPAQKRAESPALSDAAGSGIRKPLTTTIDIYKESDSQTVVVGEQNQNLLIALRAAHVYPNLCQRLADELADEDGPGWLRQILGWIAIEHGQDARTRGATIREALKARAPVPDESFLPPVGMPFRAALAWAERGGPKAGQAAETDEDERLHRYDGYLNYVPDEREAAHAAMDAAVQAAKQNAPRQP